MEMNTSMNSMKNELTNEELNAMGYRKVAESGGSFVTATYYNPETDDALSVVARDYDYADCSRDNDSVYDAEIDEDYRRMWLHSNGVILNGDAVVIVKGRKLPLMSVHTVQGKRNIKDKYGRTVATYLVFDDGTETDERNCVRVIDVEYVNTDTKGAEKGA